MSKYIEVEIPEAKITVTALLNEAEEPEMCERFWELLKEPLKGMNCHTLSTGCLFDARPRPPRHPGARRQGRAGSGPARRAAPRWCR